MSAPVMDACPFCGAREGDDDPVEMTGCESSRWVTCARCLADGPAAPTEAEAIRRWNERAPAGGRA